MTAQELIARAIIRATRHGQSRKIDRLSRHAEELGVWGETDGWCRNLAGHGIGHLQWLTPRRCF